MRSFLLPLADVAPGDVDAWRDLAGRAAEPNPFFEAEFVMPAAHRLGADGVTLAVAADGDEWLACMPVERRSRWRRFPGRWLVTWRHVYCFLGTPLVDAARQEAALDLLMDGLSGDRRATWATLEWLADDGPLWLALDRVLAERRARGVGLEEFERAVLRRRPEATYLEDTLKPSRLKELRRLGRRLEDELGEPVELEDRADDPAAYEEFMRLEASGWKGREGTALVSNDAHATLFRELCASFAERGRLQLLRLGTGERTAAMQCNLRAGDTLFAFKVAYDEELARYSPGVQLEARAIGAFHEWSDVHLVDSCADPDNELINRMWPDRRSIATIIVPPDRPLPHLLLRSFRAASSAREHLRRRSTSSAA